MDALILDFLEWLDSGDKAYTDVMDAWRTLCPRLTVWEDATDMGFVERKPNGAATIVAITDAGRKHLRRHRRKAA